MFVTLGLRASALLKKILFAVGVQSEKETDEFSNGLPLNQIRPTFNVMDTHRHTLSPPLFFASQSVVTVWTWKAASSCDE